MITVWSVIDFFFLVDDMIVYIKDFYENNGEVVWI